VSQKIGKGLWLLGFVTAASIIPIFGNEDLESSRQRFGVMERTARVSSAAQDLCFLTEKFGLLDKTVLEIETRDLVL
jgi:hypothetical protein